MKILRIVQITSVILIVLGLLGVVPTLYYRYKLANVNAAPTIPAANITKHSTTPNVITGNPVAISIPSVKINVSVVDGYYNQKSKQWTLSLDKAQFATISSTPNNVEGDTYIYGHYRPEVFAYLHAIKPGSEAAITTDNGYRFTYRFREAHNTSPADSSVFAYKGAPILTLQTCSGAWFQNRQQFAFDFISYEKI
jgi:sortase (surface protein transpeptidase)